VRSLDAHVECACKHPCTLQTLAWPRNGLIATINILSNRKALFCMHACVQSMVAAETSIRVSRETLRDLEQLRQAFQTQTAEETIRKLIRERRSSALSRMFGSGKGRVRAFTEADRLESHH
jgi:hypothetical protein